MISNIIEWKRILVANPQKNGLRFDCSCKLIMCNAHDHLLSISVNWSKVERINFTIFLKTLNWNFIIWKRLIVQGVYLHFTPFLGTGWVRFRLQKDVVWLLNEDDHCHFFLFCYIKLGVGIEHWTSSLEMSGGTKN